MFNAQKINRQINAITCICKDSKVENLNNKYDKPNELKSMKTVIICLLPLEIFIINLS